MPRRYDLERRAAQQDATRRRIVEAAIELHRTVGPAATTVSRIAERAGVGRVTVYRHFPDEQALAQACVTHRVEGFPPPDPSRWTSMPDPLERLRAALTDVYAYHRANEDVFTHLLTGAGDGQAMAPYREHWRRAADVLVAAWGREGRRRTERAAIDFALSFGTWRSLTRDHGLRDDEAVELMLRLVTDDRNRGETRTATPLPAAATGREPPAAGSRPLPSARRF